MKKYRLKTDIPFEQKFVFGKEIQSPYMCCFWGTVMCNSPEEAEKRFRGTIAWSLNLSVVSGSSKRKSDAGRRMATNDFEVVEWAVS